MKKQLVASGCLTLLLSSTMSLNAAEIACEYDANEELQQPADKVCQSREPLRPSLLANDDSSRLSRWPHCSDASFDRDGDGWGWEHHTTCVVTTPIVRNIPANPVLCSSPLSDNDGDGWGWENGASCVVNSEAVTIVINTHQVCTSRLSDSDGDGSLQYKCLTIQ